MALSSTRPSRNSNSYVTTAEANWWSHGFNDTAPFDVKLKDLLDGIADAIMRDRPFQASVDQHVQVSVTPLGGGRYDDPCFSPTQMRRTTRLYARIGVDVGVNAENRGLDVVSREDVVDLSWSTSTFYELCADYASIKDEALHVARVFASSIIDRLAELAEEPLVLQSLANG